MKKIFFTIIIIFICVNAKAYSPGEGWNSYNTALELSYYSVNYLDMNQTLWMCNDNKWDMPVRTNYTCNFYGDKKKVESNSVHREANPILGPTPSKTKIKVYFVLFSGIQTSIAWMLPVRYRETFQGLTLGLQVGNVLNNRKNSIPWQAAYKCKF